MAKDGMRRAPPPTVIDLLKSFLRVELAQVATYQKALQTLKEEANTGHDQVLSLAADHQRAVAALQVALHERGSAPVVAADTPDGDVAPVRPGSKELVGVLLDAEQRGLDGYEASLHSLDEDVRELVELELIPRQKRHVAGLAAMLVVLTA